MYFKEIKSRRNTNSSTRMIRGFKFLFFLTFFNHIYESVIKRNGSE